MFVALLVGVCFYYAYDEKISGKFIPPKLEVIIPKYK